MNTETLAELRKTHFPLVKVAEIFTLLGIEIPEKLYCQVFPKAHEIAGSYYLEPTIEQLFEVLGLKFFHLGRNTEGWTATGNGKLARGQTAKDALINLYLEVQK